MISVDLMSKSVESYRSNTQEMDHGSEESKKKQCRTWVFLNSVCMHNDLSACGVVSFQSPLSLK